MEPVGNGNENHDRADNVASDGEQLSSSGASESSSSSSSEFEEGTASPLPNKRSRTTGRNRKYKKPVHTDPRIDSLMSQMSYISNYLSHYPICYTDARNTGNIIPSAGTGNENISEPFITLPTQPVSLSLNWDSLRTDIDDKKIIPASDRDRFLELNKLQQFDSQAWKGIRYKQVLQGCLATPGFTGLHINDELCHFNKSKDYLASTELMLAGLSNKILEQRQILKTGLQSIVDWASANPQGLNPNSLFEKISATFGPGSTSHKNSEATMQVICGKRSECIEVRRERILKEITNENLRNTLRNVPPSSEYLFSREALQPIIQSLGGSQMWLNTPTYLKEKKVSERGDTFYNRKGYNIKNKTRKSDKKFKHTVNKNRPFRQRRPNGEGPNSKPKEN